MIDIVDKSTRSRMMSGIKGKDTKPEMIIRTGLHRIGFRYRLHYNKLPGKPDIVLPKYKAIILINGCFWHAHGCYLFKWPSTRKEFWREKIEGTIERDKTNLEIYSATGWKTLVIWECALKGVHKQPISDLLKEIAEWVRFDQLSAEISGKN